MRPVRFLFDQHLPLQLLEPRIWPPPPPDLLRVGLPGAPPFGTQDPELLIWCEEHQRLFVSNDRSTLPTHFADHLMAGRHSWGVMLADQEMPFKLLLHQLRLVAGATSADEWFDRIVHLPLWPA